MGWRDTWTEEAARIEGHGLAPFAAFLRRLADDEAAAGLYAHPWLTEVRIGRYVHRGGGPELVLGSGADGRVHAAIERPPRAVADLRIALDPEVDLVVLRELLRHVAGERTLGEVRAWLAGRR